MNDARHPPDADEGRQADALGRLLADAFPHGDADDAEAHWSGRASFVTAVTDGRSSRGALRSAALRSRVPRVAYALAAVALIGLAAALWLMLADVPTSDTAPPDAPLSYTVHGSLDRGDDGLMTALAPASFAFSDASTVELDAGAAVALDTRPNGVDIALDQGHIRLDVTHADDTDWTVSAGALTVRVVGTRFDVLRTDDRVNVVLHEGVVEVSGPTFEPLRMAAGHTLRHENGTVSVRPSTPSSNGGATEGPLAVAPTPTSALPTPSPQPATLPDPAAPALERAAPAAETVAPTPGPEAAPPNDGTDAAATETTAPVPSPAPREPAATAWSAWPERVADGAFDQVVSDARDAGVERVLDRASRAPLVALAEAARFSGETALAVDALDAVRTRFPDSSDAATAAFVLGRIAERRSEREVAAAWYDRYLDEAPEGALSAEALGRAMAVRAGLGQDARAAALAARYLERHPNGPYARAAASILER